MKKILAAISVVMLLLASAVSCQKEASSERQTGQSVFEVTRYTFAISVNGNPGFDDRETKAVKTGWENGDKIFLFFKPSGKNMLTDTYATMSYDGSSWTTQLTGSSSLESGGKLSAVYAPYLGSTVVPTYEDGKWNIASGDVCYNAAVATYKVVATTVSANLKMTIPEDYVQFYIVGTADALFCNNVDGFSDITIDGNLTVASKTRTKDGKMSGRWFNTEKAGVVFYGRLKGTLPTDCQFSATKENMTYGYSIKRKKLAHKAYNLGDITKKWMPLMFPGLFSVAPKKEVRFSRGNLCWTGDAFEFEKSQSAYPTSWDANHVGHFYWTTNATNAYKAKYTEVGGSKDVLFTNTDSFTVYCQTGWCTLSATEWKYLLTERTAGKSKCPVTVNGNTGLVIAPDGFTQEINDTYDAQQWAAAEDQGLVFLPKANTRTGSNIDNQNAGHYWSSTNSGTEVADYFTITDSQIEDDNFDSGDKKTGRSIRLVKFTN